MDSKKPTSSSSLLEPDLKREVSTDFTLNYSLDEIPPLPSTVTPTVETEDVPSLPDTTSPDIPSPAPSSPIDPHSSEGTSSDEDITVLRPPPSRKVIGINYSFYSGQSPSRPSGDYIDNIHKYWYWNFDLLESHHGFIQWLFPVFESSGMNMQSSALTKAEAKMMRSDSEISFRIVRSYQLMLNFYGMRLADMSTGEIERQPDFWKSRYLNLRMNGHNYLRINRILASLGHLGFHKYRKPLIEFLQAEVRAPNSLISVCESSLSRFWEMALTPESRAYERKTLESAADRVDSVFFEEMANQTEAYVTFMRDLGEWEEQSAATRRKAIERDIEYFNRWKAKISKKKTAK